MKISVVTACRNNAATLEDTILSVASQRHPAIEHVIIDGGSSDGTLLVIARLRDKIARLVSEPDRGIYDAMNKGIALATGEVLGFLNADDVYANERVIERIAGVFADPSVDACYGDLVYVDHADGDRIVRYWKSRDYRPGLFEKGWMPAHPTFFVRRRLFDQFGKFDLHYAFAADFEFTMRLLRVHGIKSVYVPEILVKMRLGGATNNSLLNIVKGNLESYRACRQHGLSITPLFIITKIASRIPQFVARPPAG